MYSDKENVNILTALLVEHGVHHAVVCPGSRNAPIVHNFNECPDISCYPVTDERSAGFYALGLSLSVGEPVAVCVTSGTALLNLSPAVAEAFYQHQPLVVVSADRPRQWIDQLDGQTMPQTDALGTFVKKAVSLSEPCSEEDRWYANRLVNEALLAAVGPSAGPVHINVPISEPLFNFTVPILPSQRKITRLAATLATDVMALVSERFSQARNPWVLAGISSEKAMLPWILSTHRIDETLQEGDIDAPDFVLYLGGTLLSKRLKAFLRKADAETWMVSEDGSVHDVFGNMTRVIVCAPREVADTLPPPPIVPYHHREEPFSAFSTVQYFEEHAPQTAVVHYANSTAIRLAAVCSRRMVYCNRGVNGIEGSLSTAAGFSLATSEHVFCIIGDLSFFYDQNALWNQNLKGNFRILLLNNGGGGIFYQLKGLEQSAAIDRMVAACHTATAEGICMQNGVAYHKAATQEEMEKGVDWLICSESEQPLLLEVFL